MVLLRQQIELSMRWATRMLFARLSAADWTLANCITSGRNHRIDTVGRGFPSFHRSGYSFYGIMLMVLAGSNAFLPARSETLWCRPLGVEHGLSQSHVTSMAQDGEGYLWFGTIGGISRWDGYEFTRFNHDDASEHSLSDAVVLALHTDRRGRLWVGTRVGLDEFDPSSETFRRHSVRFDSSVSSNGSMIECVTSDSQGRIWVGTFGKGSVYRLDPKTGTGRVCGLPGMENRWVTALHVDRHDRLWVGTQSSLPVVSPATNQFRLLVVDNSGLLTDVEKLPAREVLAWGAEGGKALGLISDRSDRLWIGLDGGGVRRLEPMSADSKTVVIDAARSDALADGHVRSITLGEAGEIWVLTSMPEGAATEASELMNRVDADSLAVLRLSLEDSAVKTWIPARLSGLLVDKSGVLWIGSSGGGLRHVDVTTGGFELFRRRSAVSPGLNSAFVRAVCVDHSGGVWVGTPDGINRIDRSGGQVRFESQAYETSPDLRGIDVKALHEDRRHRLWIGTARDLRILDPASGRVVIHRRDPAARCSISDDCIQVIHEDPEGRIWLGTLGHGLIEYDESGGCFKSHVPDEADPGALPPGAIQALFTADDGVLWIGTAAGLVRLDAAGAVPVRFRRIPGLSGKTVMSISQSRRSPGVLWIGTQQDGLCRMKLDDESCRFFTTKSAHLPHDTVYGVLPDDEGKLWLSSNQGLICFDPVDESAQRYGSECNLQSSEFNALAYCRTVDGELFFGGIGGLNAFRPERLAKNRHPPLILLTSVTVTDHDARNPDVASRIVHRHGQVRPEALPIGYTERDLTFESVALHYGEPLKNQYLYRLDGYDRDWIGPVSQRRVRYTNLDPGRYTFRVRALSSQGVASQTEAGFTFQVLPPFHATWWFRSTVICLILGLLTGAHLLRLSSLRRQKHSLETEVSARTEDLRNALMKVERQARELQALDSAKSKFFANISHEFRTPIMLTVGPLRDITAGIHGKITQEMRAEIELSLRNASRLLELVDQLLMLARFDAGELEFRPRCLDLRAHLESLTDTHRTLAHRRSLRLLVELPDAEVFGEFDESKLDQIFGNLLGNALKFTPAGGTVRLRLSEPTPEGWIRVEVEDDGHGIPAQDMPRIFDRFYRGEQQNGSVPGTGLGLAVAKECVELHSGTIMVENLDGGGARFTVTLKGGCQPCHLQAVLSGGRES